MRGYTLHGHVFMMGMLTRCLVIVHLVHRKNRFSHEVIHISSVLPSHTRAKCNIPELNP